VLGLPVGMKYERPFGNGEHVRHIRDGASLPRLFASLHRHAWVAATERMALLRWVIFQVLIGNVDAHAKNLSFFQSVRGLAVAPAYDLVCGLVYAQQGFEDTFAMAIGDGFAPHALTPYDWARFAIDCGIAPGVVCREINRLARECLEHLSSVAQVVHEEGGSSAMIERVCGVIERQAERALAAAPFIPTAAREELPRAAG